MIKIAFSSPRRKMAHWRLPAGTALLQPTRMRVPRFTRDVDELRTWVHDIRNILSANPIGPGFDVTLTAEQAAQIERQRQ